MAFDQSDVSGTTLIAAAIHSPNYATGSSGWTINKDGSAEFQNVLVRGTITASTIIGSTITGSTITAGDLQSANFSNAGMTGFDLNGTSSTDAAGTPANTIQLYSTLVIGPLSGQHIKEEMNAGQPQINFYSGLAGETSSAGLFSGALSGRPTVPFMGIASAVMANGYDTWELVPSPATSGGTAFPAVANLVTLNTTVPTGYAIKGFANIGGAASADVWTLSVQNPNKANTFVGTTAEMPFVVGDVVTPGARLGLSQNEIVAFNGTAASQTLFLNDSVDSSFLGGVVNRLLRATSVSSGSAAATNIAATAYAALPSPINTASVITCPASGVITVSIAAQVGQNAATVVGDFVALCVNVANTTQGTTPFAATDSRCATWTAIIAGGAGGNLTLSRTYTIPNCGNVGDSLTVSVFGRVGVANRFFAQRTELSVVPSL